MKGCSLEVTHFILAEMRNNDIIIFSVNVKKYRICLLSDYSALSKVWFRRLALVVRKVGNAIPWILIYRVDSVMQPSTEPGPGYSSMPDPSGLEVILTAITTWQNVVL